MKKKLMLILLTVIFPITLNCQENGFIETDNGVIHFKKFGSGEPLLIINGGQGLDCERFVLLAELLSDKYITILFDQRGTGKSDLNKVDSESLP